MIMRSLKLPWDESLSLLSSASVQKVTNCRGSHIEESILGPLGVYLVDAGFDLDEPEPVYMFLNHFGDDVTFAQPMTAEDRMNCCEWNVIGQFAVIWEEDLAESLSPMEPKADEDAPQT